MTNYFNTLLQTKFLVVVGDNGVCVGVWGMCVWVGVGGKGVRGGIGGVWGEVIHVTVSNESVLIIQTRHKFVSLLRLVSRMTK